MLISIRGSSVWRLLFPRSTRHRRAAQHLARIENLEARIVLTAMVEVDETYRAFDFNVTGSANGHTTIPGGYFGDTYRDDYNIDLIPEFSSGSVSFTSPTEGAGSASTSVEGSGRDNFGPYPIAYSGSGVGTVDDGDLFDFFIFSPYPSDNFTKTGSFNSQTWAVSTSWSGDIFDADTGAGDGTTFGSFSGFVNQDDKPLTDFAVTIDISTAEADAIHDDNHAITDVAAKVKATVTIDVSGQHMRAPSMGSPAAYVHFYVGVVDVFHEITERVPLHWNAGTLTVTLTDFLGSIDASDGDGKLHVVVDPEGIVNEFDESNNEFTKELPFDLVAKGIGWVIGPEGGDGTVLANYWVDVGGFNNTVLGSTTTAIFFADQAGVFLDANLDPEFIDPVAFRSISWLSSPDSTNGDFLQFTLPLTWRPEGATQLVAVIDRNNIPPNREINEDNNTTSLPLTELEVTGAHWNEDGSVDFNVDVSSVQLICDTNVTLYWASGDPADPTLTKITDRSLLQGSFGSIAFHVGAGTLGTPPAGTDALVILPDAPIGGLEFGKILEPIENAPALLPPNPLDLEFTGFKNTSPFGTLKPDNVDAGSYHVEPGTEPMNGQVTLFGDGSFSYTPNEDYLGDDQFDYYIQGQDGRSLTATVTIHIIPFNGTPLAQDNEYLVHYDVPLQGTLTATDDEGDDLTFSVDIEPEHGTVTIAPDGTFTYEPAVGYIGFDGFSFVVSDGTTTSVPGFIGLSIESDNTAPSISDQSFDVNEGAPNSTTVGTVAATDDEGDTLTFAIVGGNDDGAFAIDPATGEITVNNSAALVFATHPTFSLTVGVQDDGGPNLSSTATITIDLNQLGSGLSLSFGGGAVTFKKGQAAIDVLPGIVVQVPGNDIGGGRLVISMDLVRKGVKAFDTIPGLSFASLLGTVTGPAPLSDGRMQLTVDLDSFIRGEDVQTFLRAFKFTTKGRGLKIGQRTVRVQLFDSDGNGSNVMQQTINVRKK